MKSAIMTALLAIIFLFLPGIPTADAILGIGEEEPSKEEKQATIEQEKAEINAMVKKTLAKLYEVQPSAKGAIEKAAGYEVFSNFGMKLGNDFVEKGWTFGGQATAAAKHEGTGESVQDAMQLSPRVYLHQLTDTGLSAELTAKGTKHYKNDELN